MTNNRTASGRYITLILRHKPETIGIKLDEHGWADVDELLRGVNRAHCLSFEQLEEIVRTDNKQRFSFNEEKTKIRANQGHSISVDVELQEAKTKQRKQTINEAIEKCRLKGAERVAYLS